MTYYTVFYGNWNDGNSVKRVCLTINRKEAMSKARETANASGEVVTVKASRGMGLEFFKVNPER